MSTGEPVLRQPRTPQYRNLLSATLCGGLALFSSWAFAAREEEVFHVTVSIPTSDFYVLPVNPGFLEREQPLHWNPVTSTLSSLRENFDVKNSTGGITARLGYVPYLFNGRDRIDLRVRFNGEVLALDDTLVVQETEAKPGKRVPLEISALEPAGGYRAGEYYGNVQMIFDALTP